MVKIIINAFGPDEPGIVYKISKIILDRHRATTDGGMDDLVEDDKDKDWR